MKKSALYTYLGTNGTITSPVHLEGIYYVKKYHLSADKGYVLTKDNEHFLESAIVPDTEVDSWTEVKIR